MPLWTPTPIWQGQDVFLIGGGSSLKKFDFKKLLHCNTIGINSAMSLGYPIVKAVVFGDNRWWETNKWKVEEFPGLRISCAYHPIYSLPWLFQLNRVEFGLHTGHFVGWNYSTGACAINVAINLGARRIYLLGYDLCENKVTGETHWHNRYPNRTHPSSFKRFLTGFKNVSVELKRFPDVSVINVTDGTSRLPFFPVMSFEDLDALLGCPQAALPGPITFPSSSISQTIPRTAPRARQGQTV